MRLVSSLALALLVLSSCSKHKHAKHAKEAEPEAALSEGSRCIDRARTARKPPIDAPERMDLGQILVRHAGVRDAKGATRTREEACLRAEEARNTTPSESPVTSPERPSIQHAGQTFTFARTSGGRGVDTDEYTLADEKLSDWTQLVTVQRLTIAQASSAGAFVTFFQKRVAEEGASFDVLTQDAKAAVFAVRFPASNANEEQVMICLAFSEPAAGARLNVLQFAIKPSRCPVALATQQIKAWKDRFLEQAAAKSRS